METKPDPQMDPRAYFDQFIIVKQDDPLTKEEREAVNEREHREYLKYMRPQPLWAMKHYNDKQKPEDRYKVADVSGCQIFCFARLGFVYLLHFKAKSLQNPKLEAHFVARVHATPRCDTHVDECRMVQDPPNDGSSIKLLPLCCDTCGIKSKADFDSRTMELRLKAEAKIAAGGEESEAEYVRGEESESESDSELDSDSDCDEDKLSQALEIRPMEVEIHSRRSNPRSSENRR